MRGQHIIINPPFKIAEDFIRKGLELMEEGSKMYIFLKITFLAGQARRKLYEEHPPKRVYISSSRLTCAKGGDFERYKKGGAVEYAWYVWEKGYKGETILDWVN